MIHLINYPLPYKSEIGSKYWLDARGNTLAELIESAIVMELNSNGIPVSYCHVTECPSELASIAESELRRIFTGGSVCE
jgi:hypothetical protein